MSSGDQQLKLLADTEKADDQVSVESMLGEGDLRPLGENIYALLIAEVTESFTNLFKKEKRGRITAARVMFSLFLIVAVIGLQVFLLNSVSTKLCTPAMRNIRGIYSDYQKAIYGEHTYTTVNGFLRGEDGAVPDVEGFKALSLDKKIDICSVPLSQPYFTYIILLIWTITCLSELRNTLALCNNVMLECKTVGEIKDCMGERDGGKVIEGLTRGLKGFLFLFCFLPRILATLFLNYLGCRWLLATASLQDLFLNSLALEFMVVLPELLYRTFATDRGRKLTEGIQILVDSTSKAGTSLMISLVYVAFAIVWVLCYMLYLQQVLPGYNWDVRPMCIRFPEIFQQASR